MDDTPISHSLTQIANTLPTGETSSSLPPPPPIPEVPTMIPPQKKPLPILPIVASIGVLVSIGIIAVSTHQPQSTTSQAKEPRTLTPSPSPNLTNPFSDTLSDNPFDSSPQTPDYQNPFDTIQNQSQSQSTNPFENLR